MTGPSPAGGGPVIRKAQIGEEGGQSNTLELAVFSAASPRMVERAGRIS